MKWIKNQKSLSKNISEKIDKFLSLNEAYFDSPVSEGL